MMDTNAETAAQVPPKQSGQMKFFIVHTYTARERRVKELIERAVEHLGLQPLFGRIIVPTEKVMKIKKSELVSDERHLYPGYIVVEMVPSEETFRLVNSIPGVTALLGSKTQPMALPEEDVKVLLERLEAGKESVVQEAPFAKGDSVKVTTGPFAGFTGTVEEIVPDRRRVKVLVTIFGRATPIDLDFLEVQTI
ncbi:MAG: transcription termination/antitermination protein NusG [candidate division WOR-3 bacterium]